MPGRRSAAEPELHRPHAAVDSDVVPVVTAVVAVVGERTLGEVG
eukprot:CAMPEP_0174873474 /NCGR_PEP_ID=MMETSP1114-20130205/74980_1 /TAXON_ID=312471 /ORGANISM="Neobodo designis, Strain CCAP 1951/1" /LENGTH=43 /DNA_ID= /DNA_START= /DNA_END= /DNA_ORIENTATION=